nr:hypothetical protein CFP56_02160 [Quercus suber]
MQFMKKFFTLEKKLTLSDLHHEKQRVSEGLLEYIRRFRDLSLLCYDFMEEERLLDVCIAATRRTSISVRKPSKGSNSQIVSAPRQPWRRENKKVEVAMTEEPKKVAKGKKRDKGGTPPPFTVSTEELYSILEAWVKDGLVTLPECHEDPMEEEAENMASSSLIPSPLVDEEMKGDEEDGESNSLNSTQQPEEVHTAEEFVKEAPDCMNDGVKNVQEELIEVNLDQVEVLNGELLEEDWQDPYLRYLLQDLVRPTVKLVEIAGITKEDTLEIIEKMHDNAASHNHLYQANTKARHEGQVKERKFQVGEFVWKATPHVRGVAGPIKHKFSPKWEGAYIVEEAHATGHYWLKDQVGIKVYSPTSGAHLKKYHA